MITVIFGAIHLKIVADQLFCLEILSKCFFFDFLKTYLCFSHLSNWFIKYKTMFSGILLSFVNAFKISMRCLLLTLKVLASDNEKKGYLVVQTRYTDLELRHLSNQAGTVWAASSSEKKDNLFS